MATKTQAPIAETKEKNKKTAPKTEAPADAQKRNKKRYYTHKRPKKQ